VSDDGVVEQTVEVTERILISELDVTVNLVHTRPSDLVVTTRLDRRVPDRVSPVHTEAEDFEIGHGG
jgi:hypothetical protein